jgi:uncharacterized protein
MINSALQMIAKSPLQALNKHMFEVGKSIQKLQEFLDYAACEDWENAEKSYNEICYFERAGDQCKREFRLSLHCRLFTVLPRNDLLSLIAVQDSIPNQVKDITGLMLGRSIVFPKALLPEFKILISHAVAACDLAKLLIEKFVEWVESGCAEKNLSKVEDCITELDRMEHQSDIDQVLLRRKLYAVENELRSIDVMFLYQIVERIGSLADCAENIGDRIIILIAHR